MQNNGRTFEWWFGIIALACIFGVTGWLRTIY